MCHDLRVTDPTVATDSSAETDPRWTRTAWIITGTFYGAVLLFAIGKGDPEQWRWIISPLLILVGLMSLVRPQAAFEVNNPRYWFRNGVREPSPANLRWTRAGGVLELAIAVLVLVAPLL